MTELCCARCGRTFEPDVNHVMVEGEKRRMNDRNAVETFAFHEECWFRATEDWEDPA